MHLHRYALAAAAFVALATLVSCVNQSYGEKSLLSSAGYSEKQIDDATYEVRFDGAPSVSEQRVWSFWIYRCAELTKSKGHTYFTMVSRTNVSDAGNLRDGMMNAAWHGSNDFTGGAGDFAGRFIKTKGGGGHVVTTYMPGYSITTWHSHALIEMFDDTPPQGVLFAVDAQVILDMLGDFVHSGGKTAMPDKDTVVARANLRVNLSPLRGT